jgi:hypothetical protein
MLPTLNKNKIACGSPSRVLAFLHAPKRCVRVNVRREGGPASRDIRRDYDMKKSRGADYSEYSRKMQESVRYTMRSLKESWDNTKDAEKPVAIALVIAAIVGQFVIAGSIDAVERIPLVPVFLRYLGIGVTGVFVYRLTSDKKYRSSIKADITNFTISFLGGQTERSAAYEASKLQGSSTPPGLGLSEESIPGKAPSNLQDEGADRLRAQSDLLFQQKANEGPAGTQKVRKDLDEDVPRPRM